MESPTQTAEAGEFLGRRGALREGFLSRPKVREPTHEAAKASAGKPRFLILNLLVALFALGLAAATVRNAAVIYRLVDEARRLPQWDMAHRGVEGIRLAEALRHGDVVELVARLNAMSVWPPAFPLLEAPVFLAFGYDYRTARLLVLALYLLSVPAIYLAGHYLDLRTGPAIGLLAAGLLSASPFFHLFAGLVMSEVPGVLLLVLSLAAYFRALESEAAGPWRLTWGLATLLFFCKYNYGLMWLVPLLVNEAWLAYGSPWGALRRLYQWAAGIDYRRGWPLFVLVYLVVVSAIVAAGGFRFELGGARLRLVSMGSPLYHLFLLWALRVLVRPRTSWRRFRGWLAERRPRHRELVLWMALPVGVWMLIPPHAREFFHFVWNRSSGIPFWSLESFLYYPRLLVGEYAPAAWIGAAVIVLGVLPCLLLARLVPRHRVLALAILFGAAAAFFHPYKLPRFVFTLAPLLWLSAALVVSVAVEASVARFAGAPRARAAALALAGALVAIVASGELQRHVLLRSFALRTVPRAVEPVLDAVSRAVEDDEDTVLMGTWNQLSPWLVEWDLYQRGAEVDGDVRDFRQLQYLVRPQEICATLDARQVVAVDLVDGAGEKAATRGIRAETDWLRPYTAALAAADCYELADERSWGTGYRLRLYRRRPG